MDVGALAERIHARRVWPAEAEGRAGPPWWHADAERDLAEAYPLGAHRPDPEVGVVRIPRADRAAATAGEPRSTTVICTAEAVLTAGWLPDEPEVVLRRLRGIWAERPGTLRTPGDAAALLLDALLAPFAHERRRLAHRLAQIDRQLLQGVSEHHDGTREAVADLLALRDEISSLYEDLEPVNIPGMKRSLDLVWFPGVTSMPEADAVDDVLDRTLRGLRDLRSQLTESVQLCVAIGDTKRARQEEKFQWRAALFSVILLWPALVFGFYGANVDVPDDLWVMVAVAAAVPIVFYLAWFRRRDPR